MSRQLKVSILLIIILISFFSSVRINNSRYGVRFPCACPSSRDIVKSNMELIREYVESNKVNHKYPEFSQLQSEMRDISSIRIYRYEENTRKKGAAVYYNTIDNGYNYILKGYASGSAKREISVSILGQEIFGISRDIPGIFDIKTGNIELDTIG